MMSGDACRWLVPLLLIPLQAIRLSSARPKPVPRDSEPAERASGAARQAPREGAL